MNVDVSVFRASAKHARVNGHDCVTSSTCDNRQSINVDPASRSFGDGEQMRRLQMGQNDSVSSCSRNERNARAQHGHIECRGGVKTGSGGFVCVVFVAMTIVGYLRVDLRRYLIVGDRTRHTTWMRTCRQQSGGASKTDEHLCKCTSYLPATHVRALTVVSQLEYSRGTRSPYAASNATT
jgi:hypothetical protein